MDGGGGDGAKKGGAGRYGIARGASRAFCCAVLTLLLLAGIAALVLYLVYRPSKPRFAVVGAAVYNLSATSLSGPPTAAPSAAAAVSASLQFTVSIRNPNERSSLLYDRLAAYAVYRGQAITPAAPLPPLYQEDDSAVAVTLVLGGGAVPVSADVASGLETDRAYGVLPVRLVVMGRLKYRPGPFRSAWTALFVKCDVLVGVKKGRPGQVPVLGAGDCSVDT